MDSERRIKEVDQLKPGISREYLIQGYNDKVVQAYHKLMVSMAVMLGAEGAQAMEEMKEALLLERELAEFSLTKEKRRNKCYCPL